MIPSYTQGTEKNSKYDSGQDSGSNTNTGYASSIEVIFGDVFCDSPTKQFHWSENSANLISLRNKAGYIPHLKEVERKERNSMVSRIQRSLKHATLERRMNSFIMFVIMLDTLLLAFDSTDPNVPSPAWVVVFSWLFLCIYFVEIGFRLYIASPTMAFFRKRFYVFDLLIVVLCTLMQLVSLMPIFASIIRAIRLTRIFRILRLLRVLRVCTRLMEMWHDYNVNKMTAHQETVLSMDLKLNVASFKLHKVLAQQNYFQSVFDVDGGVTVSGHRKHLGVQDLFTIAKLLKEEEDYNLFNMDEFCLEWLMLLVLWASVIIGLSWAFVVLEAENYDLVIEENLALKELVDSALPVRDHIPDLLNTLADCEGNSSEGTYALFGSIYQEWNSTNRTLWNELGSFETPYTFMNPWTFEGSTFFTVSIATTIGYGTFTPLTEMGQMAVIFCSLPAIYLTIVFGQKNMELLQKGCCRTKYESVGLMVFFSIIFFLSFMIIGGWVMKNSEDWTMWEAIYFCWVSFSTMGFGDYAPVAGENWNAVFLSLVVVGWNIVIFVITVIEQVTAECRKVTWWSEQHLQPFLKQSNMEDRPSTSTTLGVAQVIYNNSSNDNRTSREEELDMEIQKCENRLLSLKNERKEITLIQESPSLSSSSLQGEGIISMPDYHYSTAEDPSTHPSSRSKQFTI